MKTDKQLNIRLKLYGEKAPKTQDRILRIYTKPASSVS